MITQCARTQVLFCVILTIIIVIFSRSNVTNPPNVTRFYYFSYLDRKTHFYKHLKFYLKCARRNITLHTKWFSNENFFTQFIHVNTFNYAFDMEIGIGSNNFFLTGNVYSLWFKHSARFDFYKLTSFQMQLNSDLRRVFREFWTAQLSSNQQITNS